MDRVSRPCLSLVQEWSPEVYDLYHLIRGKKVESSCNLLHSDGINPVFSSCVVLSIVVEYSMCLLNTLPLAYSKRYGFLLIYLNIFVKILLTNCKCNCNNIFINYAVIWFYAAQWTIGNLQHRQMSHWFVIKHRTGCFILPYFASNAWVSHTVFVPPFSFLMVCLSSTVHAVWWSLP